MESENGQTKWCRFGRWALLISGKNAATIVNTKESFIRIWGRVFRIGPGMPRPLIVKLHQAAVLAQHLDKHRLAKQLGQTYTA